jgi:hypothetical protein
VQDLLETDETAPDPLPMRVENSSMNLDDEVIRLLKHASQNFNDYPPKNPLYFCLTGFPKLFSIKTSKVLSLISLCGHAHN